MRASVPHARKSTEAADISPGWVTDVQLYNVAFIPRGKDLCEISVSGASVPPYIENIADGTEGQGEVKRGKACLSDQCPPHSNMKITLLRAP